LNKSSNPRWISRKGSKPHIAVVLWICDRLRPLLSAARVDYPRFRAMLANRLELETLGSTKLGAVTGVVGGALLMCPLGLVFGLIGIATHEPLYWLAAGQTMWLFFITMVLLNLSGDLLLDTTDIAVVAHLPVTDRTVLAARLAHAFTTIGMLGVFFAFFPTILGCAAFPPLLAVMVYPLATLLTSLTALGGVALLHATVLRTFGVTRFQRASLWVQIGTVTLLMTISQLASRVPWLYESAVAFVREHRTLDLLLPPMHFDGLWRVLEGSTSPPEYLLAAFAFALPLTLITLALRLVARRFVAALGEPVVNSSKSAPNWRQSPLARLGAWVTTSHQARASYGVALALSRRERTFLRGTWPQIGMFTAMGCGMAFGRGGPSRVTLIAFAPLALYWVAMVAFGAFDLGRYSEHANASWIFDALPAPRRASLVEGGLKALLCGTVLPVLLVLAIATTVIGGRSTLLDGVIALEATVLISLCTASFYSRDIAFTLPVRPGARLTRVVLMFAVMLASAALCGLHLLVHMSSIAQLAAIVVYAALLVWRWRALGGPRSQTDPRLARAAGRQ
jgi:hypothetical protein